MQAKLPDVNAALVTHRNQIIHAYDNGDFTKAAISFDAIISLLPKDYKPEINTAKYEELVQSKRLIVCGKCKERIPRQDIHPYQILLASLDRLITKQDVMRVWECSKCNSVLPLASSQIILVKKTSTSYFKVIPEPPTREGLHDRIGFTAKFKEWYDIAFREIEYQIGLYRTEYASQEQAVMEVIPDE